MAGDRQIRLEREGEGAAPAQEMIRASGGIPMGTERDPHSHRLGMLQWLDL